MGRTRPSRLPLGRLFILFLLLTLAPLGLLASSSLRLSDSAVRKEVRAHVKTTAAVSAVFIQEQLQSLSELVSSFAARPSLVESLDGGAPARSSAAVVSFHLVQLAQLRRGIVSVFLTDPAGTLLAIDPPTPGLVGRDFSFRDWFRGVQRTGQPYVSEGFVAAIDTHPLVVAASAYVRSPDGTPLAVLGAAYTLEAIRSFSRQVAAAQGVTLDITDQRGVSVTRPGGLTSERSFPPVTAALAGRSGLRETGRILSAYAPVPGIGWTVTANVDKGKAFATVTHIRATVLAISAGLALALLAGLLFLMVTLRRTRTVERTLFDSETRTREILDAASDAFVSMDRDGVITAWNPTAAELFGWSSEEAIGRRVSQTIVPPSLRAAHEAGLAHYKETGEGPVLNQRVEITALHRDGHKFPVELGIWPTGPSDSPTFNAFVRDISERKRAEVEVAEARDEALEASRLKSDFLANMSHEIRTPMNGVLGMTALLLDTDLDPEQRDYARTVANSAEALLAIINDILDFSKIEAGKLDLERVDFDLRADVEDVSELLASRAFEKGIELASYVDPTLPQVVRGDPGRIRQVLTNLVGNAVKFTEQGEVVLRAIPWTEGVVRFEVSDTGVGIAPEMQERMFDAFSQADASTTRRYGGTGLGLAISRQLVDLMGGEMGVQSALGRGSTFWLTLPLPAGAAAPSPVPRQGLRGLHMLVVDDNSTNRLIVSQFLASWGVTSEQAEGGEGALAALRRAAAAGRPFDAAILDFNMPGMDGLGLAREIRADPALEGVKLVLLTSSGHRDELRRAHEMGFSATMTKPVRQSQLFDCLATALGQAVADAKPRRAQVGPADRGVVLVAEDNEINQKVAVGMLTRLGYHAVLAADGVEAVEALRARRFDAVLMDCQMPGMDGYEATGAIREMEAGGRRTPVIAMTASAMAADRDRCLAAGMDDYLSKPVNLDDLAAALDRWIAAPVADPPQTRAEPAAPGPGDADPVLDPEIVADLQQLGAGTGENVIVTLAGMFVGQAEARTAAIRDAVTAGDPEAVGRAAHLLRGSSATLGARRLSRLCGEIETMAGTGDVSGAAPLLARLDAEMDAVRAALTELSST